MTVSGNFAAMLAFAQAWASMALSNPAYHPLAKNDQLTGKTAKVHRSRRL
jgi:hypothetical protein